MFSMDALSQGRNYPKIKLKIMKLLFEDRNQYHLDRYYQCESEDEYNQELAKAKADAKNSEYPDPWGKGVIVGQPVSEGEITCFPSTIVMDGFASRGGRELRAMGFTQCLQTGRYNGYRISHHFIKPDGIVQNERVETKEWWTA